MKHQSHDPWSVEKAANLYQINRWADGFFSVSEQGNIQAHPDRTLSQSIDLFELTKSCEADGLQLPAIFRFPQIAQQRVLDVNAAFDRAIENYGYRGSYRCIYPVKVSPHHDVVQAVHSIDPQRQVGLEAGSKPELLSVIATANQLTPILCNGFKDAEYIEMALRAMQLGHRVTIIVEKPSEFELIGRAAVALGVAPRIGVRMKLAAKGIGHWEATGGTKSKFGLTVAELLRGLEELEKWSLQGALEVVHFHLGSQITQIRYLKNAVIEATRIYADLVQRGLPLSVIDVGGGLGIDYCGKRMASLSSINYSWQEYANDVVYHIQSVCDLVGVRHPEIYSESGRAVVAHHSVLVIPIIGQATTESRITPEADYSSYDHASPPIRDLRDTLLELSRRNLLESYHDAEQAMEMAGNMFRHGHLSLQERADAEDLFREVCQVICDQLSHLDYVPEELLDLRERLADNNFGNFSLFQSLPDHWAIRQLFPITPLHRLDEKPTHRAVVSDITCDSDGKVKQFVAPDGESPSLLLHRRNDQPYYLGVFLAGGYQQILGNVHNLFGRVHIVNVRVQNGEVIREMTEGDTMSDMLKSVGYDADSVEHRLRQEITRAMVSGQINQETANESIDFYKRVAEGYPYLSTIPRETPAEVRFSAPRAAVDPSEVKVPTV